jgi:ParB/RepB/Spo0J family partition protein
MVTTTEPEELRLIPLDLCLEPFNDREDRDESLMQRITASINKEGFLQPIRCLPEMLEGKEMYRVVLGWTRVLCGKRAGKSEVPAIIIRRPLSETDDLIHKLIENDLRGATSVRDRIRWYYRLLELNKHWSQQELAKAVSSSPADVSKTLAISKKIPPELLEMIGEAKGKLPVRAAYALSKLDETPKIMDLADKVMKGILTVDALEAHIAKLKGGKKPKQKPIKGRTRLGMSYVLPPDYVTAQAEVAALAEALKKCERLGLPISSVSLLLKGGQ